MRAAFETVLSASPFLYCELDRDGAIRRINPVAEAFFGYGSRTLLGQPIFAFVHPEDRGAAGDAVRSAGEASAGPVRLRCERAGGAYRRTSWEFTLDARSGRVLAWGRDLHEATAVRREMEARIDLLGRLLSTRTEQLARAMTALEDERRERSSDPVATDGDVA